MAGVGQRPWCAWTSPDWFQAGGGEQVGVLVVAGIDDEVDDGLADLLWGQGRTETVQKAAVSTPWWLA